MTTKNITYHIRAKERIKKSSKINFQNHCQQNMMTETKRILSHALLTIFFHLKISADDVNFSSSVSFRTSQALIILLKASILLSFRTLIFQIFFGIHTVFVFFFLDYHDLHKCFDERQIERFQFDNA